jgi:hypothetical protein
VPTNFIIFFLSSPPPEDEIIDEQREAGSTRSTWLDEFVWLTPPYKTRSDKSAQIVVNLTYSSWSVHSCHHSVLPSPMRHMHGSYRILFVATHNVSLFWVYFSNISNICWLIWQHYTYFTTKSNKWYQTGILVNYLVVSDCLHLLSAPPLIRFTHRKLPALSSWSNEKCINYLISAGRS